MAFIRENERPNPNSPVRRQIRISIVLEPRNPGDHHRHGTAVRPSRLITRLQAVTPTGATPGAKVRAGTGYQINYRDLPRARNARQSDRPTPADVTGIVTGKSE